MSRERTRYACLKAAFTDLPRIAGPDRDVMVNLDAAVEGYRAEYDLVHGQGAFQRLCDDEWSRA